MLDTFKSQLRSEFPDYAETVIRALDEDQPVSIRVNRAKMVTGGLGVLHGSVGNVAWEPDGYYLADRPQFTLDPALHAGLYYVQEASSMVVGSVARQLLAGIPGRRRVLDLCGAPGGKATHLASVLRSDDLLVTNEVIRSRASILTENVTKWGASNVAVTSNDPSHFAALGSWFDLVVVDAPCSGEGLFRKDPAAIKEWSPEAVNHCALRQQRILDDIWPTLRPGGFLIYSTCTYNRQENDERVLALLATGDAESVRLAPDSLPGVVEDGSPASPGGHQAWMYRCFPGLVRGEGQTVSVLRKLDNARAAYGFDSPGVRFRLERGPKSDLAALMDPAQDFTTLRNAKVSFLVPWSVEGDVEELSRALQVVHVGVPDGAPDRPPHALAMSTRFNPESVPSLDITTDIAMQYLRRESIPVDSSKHGLVCITHQGIPLGFGKAVRGRLNNHYPMEWRIRMR
jgi:16S rRNA C967 or C1407 C5-methylase (RsmB/RsmF family)/NOL1/NOP2/fmu family ribosome biogenesis protein